MPTAGHADAAYTAARNARVPLPVIDDRTPYAPAPLYDDPRKTVRIEVSTVAPGYEKCKCGAIVNINPDDVSVKPMLVLYDHSKRKIVGCPSCLIG